MIDFNFIPLLQGAVLIRLVAATTLEFLNQKAIQQNATQLGPATTAYSLENSRFAVLSQAYLALLTLILLNTPLLQKAVSSFTASFILPFPLQGALLVYSALVVYSLCFWPLQLYKTFVLEARHGFNTTTFKLWLQDQLKLGLLSLVLFVPLLSLLFSLPGWVGSLWWLYAALAFLLFQLLLSLLFPQFLLPLFNRLTPLPQGELKNAILTLAQKLNFAAKAIFVMDGSKRSKHSNAFFTGLGKNRKIVFFDTLINQLSVSQLKAVFAHEVGHYKKKHLTKKLLGATLQTITGFFLLTLFMHHTTLSSQLGLRDGSLPQLLLVALLFGGLFSFWLQPVFNVFSRKFEYQADAFAKAALQEGKSLVAALEKLYQENLTNPRPHPLYSFFYHSHPTLYERKKALEKGG